MTYKPASLPVYPPNPCRIPASVFDGAPEIKSTINSNSNSNSGSLRIVGTCCYRVVSVAIAIAGKSGACRFPG
ncbi:hypothetical protein A7318_23435 [Pseudomonas lurida]|nr:hypothetical protein A7318_23435 [Pseudomonas lurida]